MRSIVIECSSHHCLNCLILLKGHATIMLTAAALNSALRVPSGAHTGKKFVSRKQLSAFKAHGPNCNCCRKSSFQVIRASASTTGVTPTGASKGVSVKDDAEMRYLSQRAKHVQDHFEGALGADDFMQRLEVALWGHGFQNDNSIACVNLCRDESTLVLKHKIDQVFGSSFSIHGLGGVLTCGVTGVGAGLSHSPVCQASGKERYVFFSFPHIAIDSNGVVGNISRPGRAAMSCACGALIKSLGDMKEHGLSCSGKQPGVHDPEDIELSILKQRLARKLQAEGVTDDTMAQVDLVHMTKVAERTITGDLEELISHAVDTSKADYAVVTGVQIHNWASEFDGDEPNLEWVFPTNVYAVVGGKKTVLNLSAMPALTPRQMRLLASAPDAHAAGPLNEADAICNTAGSSSVREIDPPYMHITRAARRKVGERMSSYLDVTPEQLEAAGDEESANIVNQVVGAGMPL